MNPKTDRRDPLRELTLFDPDTAEMVRGELSADQTTASAELLSLLSDETIWALSREISFGRTVARGICELIRCAPERLSTYRNRVRDAGTNGPTLGRLMARHLVAVLIFGQPVIRKLYLEAFAIMVAAGAYTLPKPLAALDRILRAGDLPSAKAYLGLLCSTFTRNMNYSRRQQLAVLLPRAAMRCAPAKRLWQLQQLQRVMKVDDRLALALMTGMDHGLDLLSSEALSRFVSQGLQRRSPNRQRAERFFALQSRAGRMALDRLQVAASLFQVQAQLNRYLRARTGRGVRVRPLSALSQHGGENPAAADVICSDRHTVYLPDEVNRFEKRSENIRVYKGLVRFESGIHEFATFDFDLERALERCRANPQCLHLPNPPQPVAAGSAAASDLEQFFDLFPRPPLAADLFLVYEHGRILHLLAQRYPGLVSAFLSMFQQEARVLLSQEKDRHLLLPIYAHIACGLSLEALPSDRADEIRMVREAAALFDAAMQQRLPAAETSGQLVAASYSDFDSLLGRRKSAEDRAAYRPLQTPFQRHIRPDLAFLSDRQIERTARSIKQQLADRGVHIYASVLRSRLALRQGELSRRDMEEIVSDADNYTQEGRAGGKPVCGQLTEVPSDALSFVADVPGQPPAALSADTPAYWYREWDCQLGDYLNKHVRVRECPVSEHPSNFYSLTLSRYAGLVQQIRSAFELLRPQGLKWYRCWIEGEEFDYRQLLDFALDRRAGRTPSERLYIKRLKAVRDVSVLLLVDLSRSTANPVAGSDASVLEVEKEAIVLFSEALQVVGDRYAIDGFSGAGRLGVEYCRIKSFDDPLDDSVRWRISAMSPRRNTRMGAAIRHAANRLSLEPSRVKLLILLGDGFPNDLNYKKAYAVEDTRRAIEELRAQGIHVHAITVNINPQNTSRLDELFGDIHHNLISEVTDLPDRLWRIYGALTR